MNKKVLIIGIVVIAILCVLGVWLLLDNEKSYDIKITIPDSIYTTYNLNNFWKILIKQKTKKYVKYKKRV